MNLIKALEQLNFHIIEGLNRKYSFNRDHIFYDVLDIVKHSVSEKDRLDILYTFNLIEKSLLLIKENIDDNSIHLITDKYNSFNEDLKKYISVSYAPMMALKEYNNKNYDLSINYLQLFFENAPSILDTKPLVSNLAICEQFLNFFRIYKIFNEELSLKIARDLLLFCNYDLILDDSHPFLLVRKKIEFISETEKNFWKIYHTDNIFKHYLTKSKREFVVELINLLLPIIKHKKDYLSLSIQSIYYLSIGNKNKGLDYFQESLQYFQSRSDTLLYLNIIHLQESFLDNKNLESIFNDFINNESFYFKKYIEVE